MSRKRIFEPVITTLMRANQFNHGPEVQFKLSYGYELNNSNSVFKIQTVSEGKINGRQAPSYSDNDFDKIVRIRAILKDRFNNMDNRLRDIEIPEEEINLILEG